MWPWKQFEKEIPKSGEKISSLIPYMTKANLHKSVLSIGWAINDTVNVTDSSTTSMSTSFNFTFCLHFAL